jgi:hypothetical protein
MTESIFRKQLGYLWLTFVFAGLILSRLLLISGWPLNIQKMLYLTTYIIAIVGAIRLYRSTGKHKTFLVVKQAFDMRPKGKFGRICAMIFLTFLQFGLLLAIWDSRYEPHLLGILPMLVGVPVNFVFTWTCFMLIRNEQLRRQGRIQILPDQQNL